MIDWWGLVHNSLWITGLAVSLAALSVADYQAHYERVRLRLKLDEPGFQLALCAGMTLFCLGLLFSSRTWWERVMWGLLALLFATQVVWLWHRHTDEVSP
jgi:hypothetical protein